MIGKAKIATLALAGVLMVAAGSAGAQYYDPYRGDRGYDRDRGSPRYDDRGRGGYDRGYDRGNDRDYRRGGYDGGGYDRRGGGRDASICLTGRGSCAVPSAPKGISCRCEIDGLTKRGIVQ